jgi:hypothetical protein
MCPAFGDVATGASEFWRQDPRCKEGFCRAGEGPASAQATWLFATPGATTLRPDAHRTPLPGVDQICESKLRRRTRCQSQRSPVDSSPTREWLPPPCLSRGASASDLTNAANVHERWHRSSLHARSRSAPSYPLMCRDLPRDPTWILLRAFQE